MKITTNTLRNGYLVIELILDYPDELDEYKDESGWVFQDLEDAFSEAMYGKIRIITDEEKPPLNIYTSVPAFTDLGDPEDFEKREDWLNQDWSNHSWVDVAFTTDPWVLRLAENKRITLKVRRYC